MEEQNFRYDSRYQSLRKRSMQEAIEFILDKQYGETIQFEQMARVLGFNIDDEGEYRKFRSAMARVRNFIIDYGYVLKSISGVGYYILKPKHISSYCYRTYIDRSKVLLEKSQRILNRVDETDMSDVRKQEHQEMLTLNQDIYNGMGLTIETSEYGQKRAFYNNLDD